MLGVTGMHHQAQILYDFNGGGGERERDESHSPLWILILPKLKGPLYNQLTCKTNLVKARVLSLGNESPEDID